MIDLDRYKWIIINSVKAAEAGDFDNLEYLAYLLYESENK
jgi:hypothetical protein